MCLAEIHHRGKKLQAFAKDISRGRVAVATEADPSGRSDRGTSGGVAALASYSLDVTLPNGSSSSFGCWQSPQDSAFLVGLQVNLRQEQTLQVFSSYHLDEPSAEVLATVHKRTQGGALPFLLLGDYNMDRRDFEAKHQHWLLGLNAVTIGCNEGTCSLGQKLELD